MSQLRRMHNRDRDCTRSSEHWLEKAEKARAIAREMSEKGGKATMERIAALFERIADSTARREGIIRKQA
jgi:hypothetical protein